MQAKSLAILEAAPSRGNPAADAHDQCIDEELDELPPLLVAVAGRASRQKTLLGRLDASPYAVVGEPDRVARGLVAPDEILDPIADRASQVREPLGEAVDVLPQILQLVQVCDNRVEEPAHPVDRLDEDRHVVGVGPGGVPVRSAVVQ